MFATSPSLPLLTPENFIMASHANLSDHEDDTSAAEDFDEEEYREQHEVHDHLRKGRVCLGLGRGYVHQWRPQHGFREFYQNWMDGIKESNKLSPEGFKTKIKDNKTTWLLEALHPETRRTLGYIRFLKNKGQVEMTNFGAQLSIDTLDLGYSTKRKDKSMAGAHGEGYKLACLVFAREDYLVSFATSSFSWNFRFAGTEKRQLYCCFNPTKDTALAKLKNTHYTRVSQGKTRKLKGNIWEDVTIKMGARGQKGRKITEDEFISWRKQCMDLDHPSSIIQTSCGDLILDPNFSGRTYLMGLLLESKSQSNPPQFAYNFAQGYVNRDRQKMADAEEEGKMITNIWGEALKRDPAETLRKYISMLRAEKQCFDVTYAEYYISKDTASSIWHSHLDEDPNNDRFYYDCESGDKDVEVIKKCLKKKPVPVKRSLWNSLRKYGLVRTPDEQRHHLLQNAPSSTIKDTTYAEGVKRTLRAVLASDPRSKDLELQFKSGAKAELDLLLHRPRILVNDRILDFYTSHRIVSCSLSRDALYDTDLSVFSCSHIVIDFYEMLLVEMSRESVKMECPETDAHLRNRVNENILQMPCMVTAMPGIIAGEIEVSWLGTESEKAFRQHRLAHKGRVTLHRESSCSIRKHDLLARGSIYLDVDIPMEDDQINEDCGCPEEIVLLKDSKVTFKNLNHEDEYFPMVAKLSVEAFFGLPPNPIRPKEPRAITPEAHPAILTPSKSNHPHVRDHHDVDDLYSASPMAYPNPSNFDDHNGDDDDRNTANNNEINPALATHGTESIAESSTSAGGRSAGNKGKELAENTNLRTQLELKENEFQVAEIDTRVLRREKEQALANQQLEDTAQLPDRTTVLEEQLDQKTKQISVLKAQVEDNLDTIKQCVKAHEDTQKKLLTTTKSAQTAIQMRESHIKDLKRRLEERDNFVSKQKDDFTANIKTLQTDIEALRNENQELQATITELEEDLETAKDSFAQYVKLNSNASARNERRKGIAAGEKRGVQDGGGGSVSEPAAKRVKNGLGQINGAHVNGDGK